MECVADPSSLFSALPVPAFALSSAGEVVAWNTAAERAFGWPRAEVLGRPAPLFPGPALAVALEALRRVAEARCDDAIPLACAHRGGATRIVRLGASEAEGALLLVAARGGDAAADGAGEALRLQAVLDAIPAPIFFKDGAGAYLGFNAAFERYLGIPRERLLGRTVFDIAPRDLAEVYRAADDALLRSGVPQIYETRVEWPDGTRRDVVFHKALLHDGALAGAPIGLAGAMLDVTDQRAAERSLRAALEAAQRSDVSFRRLVESVPDLVVIHERGRISYANPAMRAVLQLSPEEVEGSSALDWLHPADGEAIAPYLIGDAPMPPWQLRLRARDGSLVTAEFRAISIDMGGRPVRVAIGRDLTERTQAQERLARAQRLAAIGTLAAGVAHELNNPLTFVLSNVELVADGLRMLRGAPPDADGWDEASHALDDALEGAERMRVIVRDLRTMARADDSAGGPVDVRKLLENAANLASNDVRPRARLVWEVADVPPVRGSEGRLGQVFVNLIVNAAHAIPEGHPEDHVIRLSAALGRDGKVAIYVSDTGAGIPPENLSRIFDPFFTTKPAGIGTGLGLWVCHNIVSAFGGTLDVTSEVGRGTRFRVLLPAAGPGETARAVRREPRDGRERRRLLVVDDEPLVAASVRRQLATDFVVDAACGAADALARIAADRYDAVVCDVTMEGPNGLEFLDALRREEPDLARRVLLVTGGVSPAAGDLLSTCGAPWLAKPFDGRQLRRALRDLLA